MEAPGPSTTSTVSASGVDAITATLDVEQLEQSGSSIEEIYDVKSTVDVILRGGWTRVCLQFPDELLHDSVQVFRAIRARLPPAVELYVMADTTYGSCCVDEVAAQHVDGQMVVHYGHACLSAPARLSVLYVFPKLAIDPEDAASKLAKELSAMEEMSEGRQHLLLLTDVAYHWRYDTLYEKLQSHLAPSYTLVRSEIDTKAYLQASASLGTTLQTANRAGPSVKCCTGNEGKDQQDSSSRPIRSCCTTKGAESPPCGCRSEPRQTPSDPPTSESRHARSSCRSYHLPQGTSLAQDYVVIYVGSESLALNNLLLSNPTVPILSYDPKSGSTKLESSRTNKMLMRRYATIQRARDADVFGIVVGTLGVSSYLPTLAYLRKLLRKHQKKSYTMAVGKLTPAKLGNFLEVECWVLVACGENSLVEGHKEFMKPIITPWELEVALGERDWISATDGDKGYTLDFSRVLHESSIRPEGRQAPAPAEEGEQIGDDPEGPTFSTVTGKYRYRRTYGGKEDVQDADDLARQAGALSIRNNHSALSTVLSSAGGELLATRTFKGLEPRYGQDAPAVMEAGRSGIAREYGGDQEALHRERQTLDRDDAGE